MHIISFSIPYPANYGGVIDVFYKLKALYNAGVKVTLHCFQYDREPATELDAYCENVYYYPRKMTGIHLLGFHPFIVASRKNEKLIENLLKDDYPILYEGLHTCFSINDARLDGRKKIVRSHNLEHDYYAALAKVEKKTMKRLYFKSEAKKLKRFESIAYNHADTVLGISQKDTDYLNKKYSNAINVSAFHGYDSVNSPKQTEAFALYHGNLSVGENNEAALFLVNEVFKDLGNKLIIAGNQPSLELKDLVAKLENISIKEDLSSEEIDNLIHKARVNVLPTFQSTGIKLKLLAALYNGGHCLVNSQMVVGTKLESLVSIADSADEFKGQLIKLMEEELSVEAGNERIKILESFSNSFNISKILKLF